MIRLFYLSVFFILNRINIRLLYPTLGNHIEVWRRFALCKLGSHIGCNSFVRAGSYIYMPQNLNIGNNSKINNKCSLYLFEKLYIGDNVEIGPDFLVYTGEHKFSDSSKPLAKQGEYSKPVHISDDVYIGARVTILKGSYIENRVVIAAGSVVSGRIESGHMYGGVPAKIIKKL